MSNDSSTGGPLVPSSTAPSDDDALIDFLQSVIVGVTGLPGNMCRPRWQQEPANLPAVGTNWASLGITERRGDLFPYVAHQSAGNGTDTLANHEWFTLLTTFYGPLANTYATQLRDGLAITQNREAMFLAGVSLVNVPHELVALPELVKERWLYRIDMPLRFVREVGRVYPVLNLLSAAGNITGSGPGEAGLVVPITGNLTRPVF
jgi:hypothetical protein